MIIKEAQSSIGREVRYHAFEGEDPEFGVITSVNDHVVFVRYYGDQNAQATSPGDITLTLKELRAL